jgi:flagellin-like hook-associated protein FlgL
MKREKFNGVELFAIDSEWDDLQGMNKSHLVVNGEDYVAGGAFNPTSDELYEYFDNPDQTKRTETEYDKFEFELYTHPTGVSEDGNIKLNIVNLEFMLGLKNPNTSFGLTAPTAGSADATTNTNPLIASDSTINLGGLDQPTLAAGQATKLTNNTGTGYIKDITQVSIEEFTNIIEKIADVRAENGAEQQRVNQSLRLHQNNLVNLEAAHGRIMDVDVALESTRLARHSVKVQASAAMVAQANQMTSVALTLLQ